MERLSLIREKVFDPVLRIIHLWIALAILLLLLSSQIAKWIAFTPEAMMLWRFHVWFGYALVLGLVARVSWAVYGPVQAGWRQFWTWRVWLQVLQERKRFVLPQRFGLHPLATVAYLLLYAMLWLMAFTGLALAAIKQGQGPFYHWLGHDVLLKSWFNPLHAFLDVFILIFVLGHIAALIWFERHQGFPTVQAMVSGYQYRQDHRGRVE